LSGGEKALTALALLIAMFRFKPSPFCVLDEVDAPLDEANVDRFANMVREMSVQTQFIVITHSKRTMETASTLYGVTMEEPGISKNRFCKVELTHGHTTDKSPRCQTSRTRESAGYLRSR
jgi:chromosome segregation protein